MKQITVENYQSDKYYPGVVRAVDSILARGDCVSAIDVFIQMGLLSLESVAEWRAGRLPFLERGIKCNLSAANRILRLLRMHAHDLISGHQGRKAGLPPLIFLPQLSGFT